MSCTNNMGFGLPVDVAMARGVEENQSRPQTHHLVLFPCPFQGHINPMLQLATLLHSRGFSITIAHTQFNSPNPSNFPNFCFEPIPDGLKDVVPEAASLDHFSQLSIINANCAAPFRDLLTRMISEKPPGSIACVITDDIMSFTQSVTDSLNLRRVVLLTGTAMFFVVTRNIPLLCDKGYYSIQDPLSEVPVLEIPPLRVKDIPLLTKTMLERFLQLMVPQISATRASSGLIFNTVDCLEQTTLTKIRQELPIPVFTVGPLHKLAAGSSTSSSLLMPDCNCMAWLDQKPLKSVVYVSFGSLVTMERADVMEVAWGLANSGQPFLWVVRPGSVNGLDWVELPEEFEKETVDRGLVVKWVPQQEVLAHPSVGGFWTHNGWNSTLESISEGVPMLCRPCVADQMANARMVSHVWRVGIWLEKGLERGEIEWAIRRLMVGSEGEQMRERMKDLKENVDRSLRKGGSSYQSLDSFIDFIKKDSA